MWTYVTPLVLLTFTENNIVVSAGIILESDPLRCINLCIIQHSSRVDAIYLCMRVNKVMFLMSAWCTAAYGCMLVRSSVG